MTLEQLSDPVSLLCVWSVDRPPRSSVGELLVRDGGSGVILHSVDPRVSDAVGELLFLSPQNGIWEVGLAIWRAVERFSEDVLQGKRISRVCHLRASRDTHLLHHGLAISVDFLAGSLAEHLVLGVDVHGNLQELLVEEGHSSFQTPGHCRLVGS